MLLTLLTLYFVLQLALPVRHYFIEGDVLWTEEGHRMSWRMMLRSRSGNLQFRVVDKESGEGHLVNLREWLTSKQRRKVQTHPDFIWQFSQHLKKQYAAKGKEISVFVVGEVRINRKDPAVLIDPKTDLAAEPWDPYRHHSWILPAPF